MSRPRLLRPTERLARPVELPSAWSHRRGRIIGAHRRRRPVSTTHFQPLDLGTAYSAPRPGSEPRHPLISYRQACQTKIVTGDRPARGSNDVKIGRMQVG